MRGFALGFALLQLTDSDCGTLFKERSEFDSGRMGWWFQQTDSN